MAWWIPVLTALGVNAGKNLLTGKNITDNAIQAGITGGILGAINPAGAVSAGDAAVASNEAAAGVSSGATSGATSEATSGISGAIPGSIESELGSVNPVTGTYLAKDQYANFLGNPIYKGGEGLLSNAASEAGSMLGKLAPDNFSGVASLLSEPQDTSGYRQMAGTGGGMKQGSGSKLAVEFPQAKVFKRRKV